MAVGKHAGTVEAPGAGPRFPVRVQLSGQDGNAFAILGRVQRALRKAGATNEELGRYVSEATSGSYEHLIAVTAEWVEVR